MAWQVSKWPGNFADCLESFQMVWKVFKRGPLFSKTFQVCYLASLFFFRLCRPYQQSFYKRNFISSHSSKISVMRFLVLLAGCLVTSTAASLPSLSLAHHSPEEFARLHRPLLRFDGSAETFCYPDMVIREQFLWLTTLLRQQTRTTTSANRSTPPPRSTTASLSVEMVTLSWSWLGRQAAFITLYNLKSWSKALLVWQAEGLRSLWSGPGASPKNLKGVQPTKCLSQIRSANWEICRVTNWEIHRDTNLEICRVTVTTGNTSLSTLWGMARGNMYRTASPGCYPSSSSIFIFPRSHWQGLLVNLLLQVPAQRLVHKAKFWG